MATKLELIEIKKDFQKEVKKIVKSKDAYFSSSTDENGIEFSKKIENDVISFGILIEKGDGFRFWELECYYQIRIGWIEEIINKFSNDYHESYYGETITFYQQYQDNNKNNIVFKLNNIDTMFSISKKITDVFPKKVEFIYSEITNDIKILENLFNQNSFYNTIDKLGVWNAYKERKCFYGSLLSKITDEKKYKQISNIYKDFFEKKKIIYENYYKRDYTAYSDYLQFLNYLDTEPKEIYVHYI